VIFLVERERLVFEHHLPVLGEVETDDIRRRIVRGYNDTHSQHVEAISTCDGAHTVCIEVYRVAFPHCVTAELRAGSCPDASQLWWERSSRVAGCERVFQGRLSLGDQRDCADADLR
jgi:hypothetical protein